ncbi:hypothetical protein CA85_22030 [Allorhodopirellula solitaria]|uniref:Uncharacterized protein n=1 Tax=Allorhodopirellula solitaria TaxID=2527987 RepID=A0A5C5XYI7_9BACT|nr:hypothetical protein CA85_22030 [Allorhodopirellula solitaria]
MRSGVRIGCWRIQKILIGKGTDCRFRKWWGALWGRCWELFAIIGPWSGGLCELLASKLR